MVEWKTKPIRELGRIVTGKTPPKVNLEYFNNGKELFVSPKDLDWNQFYVTETKTVITDKALEKFKNQVIPKNAIMFTCISFAFGKMGIASRSCLTNQQINTVIVNKEHNYRFVYYLLKANKPIIFSYNSGIDTPIVPKSVFESIEVKCPPLETQRKIAAILSAYDDLIENNKRRIAILENMAEEIYREWFVRFRFPGWKDVEFVKGIPKGWEVVKIGDSKIQILDGDRGKAYPKKDEFSDDGFCLFLSTSNVREGKFKYSQCDFITEAKDSQLRKGRVNIGDIVLTTRGTIGNIAYLGNNSPFKVVRINSGMVIIRAAENIFKTIFYYLLFNSKSMQDNYKMFSSGSAQPQLPIRDLKKIEFILPPDEILLRFGKIIKPIIDQSDLMNVQNIRLNSIKEKLLTRLISGKLSVEDLDICGILNTNKIAGGSSYK